jgi:hypothetical protein
MNKYGTYKIFYCKERHEYFHVPHDDIDRLMEKYAEQGLTLIEVDDPYEPSKMHIVQPG